MSPLESRFVVVIQYWRPKIFKLKHMSSGNPLACKAELHGLLTPRTILTHNSRQNRHLCRWRTLPLANLQHANTCRLNGSEVPAIFFGFLIHPEARTLISQSHVVDRDGRHFTLAEGRRRNYNSVINRPSMASINGVELEIQVELSETRSCAVILREPATYAVSVKTEGRTSRARYISPHRTCRQHATAVQ
jgi:hypothetical protein